ncbi:MAG: MOSC domain-containing protein [Methylophilaceae bacterium]|nr:MOSC domain-containing protein [Methylophilaceae bacterium]
MPRVVALYRYPVKGFTPEGCDALTVLDEGRIAGDRVLGIRFANSSALDDAWSKKNEFVALVNTPGLACLTLRFDHRTLHLDIGLKGSALVGGALDDTGRKRIALAIENYVLQLDENPLSSHPERTPLRVVGDGVAPRYQDNEAGQITLHSRESLAAVATAVSNPGLSELRFRSNIVIEGLEAWEELNWVGRKICIGQVIFDGVAMKGRCLATHVNPDFGERDITVLKTLANTFNQDKPTFAIGMVTNGAGGQVHIGDKVSLVD